MQNENPYKAPASDPSVPKPISDFELASRWERLFAGVIDAVLFGAPAFLATKYLGLWVVPARHGPAPTEALISMAAFGFISYAVINFYLLHRFGQSFGKMVVGIKIVDLDNNKPSAIRILLIRQLPSFLLHPVPFAGNAYQMLDMLMIFGPAKRCIHDYLAGTKVVKEAKG